ncbi:MAG: PAS domain-containing protein [Burkholderiaceae bacterium]|nr:PAS domain-containing protein [Burkholderiaceae bacterium]
MNPSPDARDRSYYLQRLVDQVPALLAYWDRDQRCRFANQAYSTWFGVEPAALIGRPIRDLLGPDLFALNEPYIVGALAGRKQVFERIVPGPNGEQRHSLATYVPDIVDGVVVGFLAQVAETTPLKAIERELRISKALLDQTGRLAGVGGWKVDLLTMAITWSDHTRRIHDVEPGYRPTLSEGINFYAPEARPVIKAAVEACMRDGTSWDLELPFITATGRNLWVRTFGEVEHEAGRPVRLIGAFQDITEHRLRREDLYRERQLRSQSEEHARELELLLRERSEMLDVMAHEVRQPLNSASAALQSASAALGEERSKAVLDRLVRAQNVVNSVVASIDNTLAVASLLARPEPIQRADTNIDTMLNVALMDLPPAERYRIRIERATSTHTASMDMSLMRLAMRNLLSNALKYSPPESMVAIRLAESDHPLALIIDVTDSGPGFDSALLPRLFERGVRTAGAAPRAGHGLGLGLYIVRRVMELHGGQAVLLRNGPEGATIRLVVVQ